MIHHSNTTNIHVFVLILSRLLGSRAQVPGLHCRESLREGRECYLVRTGTLSYGDSHYAVHFQIHEVAARRFCLVAADHPLVSAISENAEKLQSKQHSLEQRVLLLR